MSVAAEMIQLISPWPLAGGEDEGEDRAMRLLLARQMSDVAYEQLITFVEFQRRLCNQQFDNLLEQLKMFRASFVESIESAQQAHEATAEA